MKILMRRNAFKLLRPTWAGKAWARTFFQPYDFAIKILQYVDDVTWRAQVVMVDFSDWHFNYSSTKKSESILLTSYVVATETPTLFSIINFAKVKPLIKTTL